MSKELNITNKCLSKNEWESIEEKVDDNFKKISSSMVEFSEKIYLNDQYTFELLSNNTYQIDNFDSLLFDKFVEHFKKLIPKGIVFNVKSNSSILTPENNKKKNKNKKINSGQQMKDNIRLKNFIKKLDEDLVILEEITLTNFSDKSFNLVDLGVVTFNFDVFSFGAPSGFSDAGLPVLTAAGDEPACTNAAKSFSSTPLDLGLLNVAMSFPVVLANSL
jgi:hypothetical protein